MKHLLLVAHLVIGAILSLGLAAALAQSPSADSTAADLFDEAVLLRNAGKWKPACEKFAASQKLAPARGTLLNIAECHERYGDIASAWTAYGELADLAAAASDDERLEIARRRMRDLEPRLPRIVIKVKGASPPGLVIKLDGVEVGGSVIGSSVPVDSGKHRISAAARDHQPWWTEIEVKERESIEVIVPELPALTTPAETAPANDDDEVVRPDALTPNPDTPAASTTATAPAPARDRGPSLLTSVFEIGLAFVDFDDRVDTPSQRSFRAGLGYPMRFGKLSTDLGAALTLVRIPWADSSTGASGTAQLTSVLVNFAARYPLAAKLALRAELGLGLQFFSGLAKDNPFTINGAATAGALAMLNARMGLGVEYSITDKIVVTVAPAVYSYSPAPADMAEELTTISRFELMAGVGFNL